MTKKDVYNALVKFGKKVSVQSLKEEKYFTPDKKADAFIWKNPLAFLLAVLVDQSVKAEFAWSIPFKLKKRLGFWNVEKIANIKDSKIIEIFDTKPKLHRFPTTMALRVKKACQKVIDNFGGDAKNVWEGNLTSREVHNNFESFLGIGQKKASMATNILVRDFNLKVKDYSGIDVSFDIHIRRVFLRSGLVKNDDFDEVLEVARKLNKDYPGIIDLPAWYIGKHYCKSSNPNCFKCPIKNTCPKKLSIEVPKGV